MTLHDWWAERRLATSRWWRAGPFLTPGAVLTLVVIVVGGAWIINSLGGLTAENQARIDQINESGRANSEHFCEVQRADRQVLRDVISSSFAPRPAFVLPTDPNVPQPTIDYLQRLFMASSDAAALKDLLLSKAPIITCVKQPDGRTIPASGKA